MTRIAIIGTAGRTHTDKITIDLYNHMIIMAQKYLQQFNGPIVLVSGGAALSDHIAVELYLNQEKYGLHTDNLELHLPSEFNTKTCRYHDTGYRDWRENPGRIANMYHDKFSEIIKKQTLSELGESIKRGANMYVYKGFHERNTSIATADYMLAFTWDLDKPSDGGTKDTWNKAGRDKCERTHISLLSL